jgi:hypothetical protein
MAGGVVIASTAYPATATVSHYPDLTTYKTIERLERFRVIGEDGAWFVTPLGLECAILEDATYGCSGTLAGAPNGENEIGWFHGDSLPRLYHTDDPKFDSGARQGLLPPTSFFTYRGSRCASTLEGAVYCINGENADSQLMVSGDMTFRGSQALPAS